MSEKLFLKSSENDEIEETEILRSQSLAQFKEWIEKDPNIIKCRTDDAFLLRFLRTKKFRISDAFQLLENYLSVRKILPHLFVDLNVENAEFDYFIEDQIAYALPEADKNGRIVLFSQMGKIDANKCTGNDCIKYCNLCCEYLCLDERSQKNGIIYILDYTGLQMSFLSLFTPTFLKDFIFCWQKNFPLRHKLIYYVNMPTFMNALLQIILSFLSKKMKSRLKIVSDYKEISEELGIKILPKELGGNIPSVDLANQHKKLLIKARDEILAINNLDIKISKKSQNFGNRNDAELDSTIVGSFRKIAVD